ncbi:MAG: hypothetical protein H6Q20_2639 [Bacteroidetes bacterium]|nr:hypothetical protein [Bacteroidota bacterium]
MKKYLFIIFFLSCVVYSAFAQYLKKDSASYSAKSLKLDEVNLVTGYYSQTGDHATTLGGAGDEKVQEISSAIDLKFVGYSNPNYIHSLTAGLGFAYHTAASAAWVSKTGASRKEGTRIYPSLDWSVQNLSRKTEYSLGLQYSNEFNYQSLTLNTGYSKTNKTNGEFGFKLNGSFDRVKMIYAETMDKSASVLSGYQLVSASDAALSDSPLYKVTTAASGSSGNSGSHVSSSDDDEENFSSKPRTTLTAALSYNQIINQRMQVAFLADFTGQFGYLGLPFHRVFMADAETSKLETLPDNRLKLPLAVRLNYFMGDRVIFRTYYRYYTDSWGINAHTAYIETPIKISPFFSVSPFYRYYTQTGSKYFAPFAQHTTSEEFYTSNYSYSAFNAHFGGLGVRWLPKEDGFVKSVELRYGYYKQTTGLASNVITLHLKF